MKFLTAYRSRIGPGMAFRTDQAGDPGRHAQVYPASYSDRRLRPFGASRRVTVAAPDRALGVLQRRQRVTAAAAPSQSIGRSVVNLGTCRLHAQMKPAPESAIGVLAACATTPRPSPRRRDRSAARPPVGRRCRGTERRPRMFGLADCRRSTDIRRRAFLGVVFGQRLIHGASAKTVIPLPVQASHRSTDAMSSPRSTCAARSGHRGAGRRSARRQEARSPSAASPSAGPTYGRDRQHPASRSSTNGQLPTGSRATMPSCTTLRSASPSSPPASSPWGPPAATTTTRWRRPPPRRRRPPRSLDRWPRPATRRVRPTTSCKPRSPTCRTWTSSATARPRSPTR